MTSNFRNSAGTDLDDVFYVNNSNAGALGFLIYNGQDLGNRYPSGSLGYNVGYKNSAGTDIGYLRCKLVAPTASINVGTSNVNTCNIDAYMYTREVSGHISYPYYYVSTGRGTLTCNISSTNGMPINSVDWYVEVYTTSFVSSSFNWTLRLNCDSNVIPSYKVNVPSKGTPTTEWSNATHTVTPQQDAWIRSASIGASSTTNKTISYCIGLNMPNNTGDGVTYIRCVAYVSNSVGGTWVTSPQITIYNH